MKKLLKDIRSCSICKDFLPNAPRPIIQAHSDSRIVIIGQAPGQKVQNSGVPWDDASGNTLRKWLGVDKETFYYEKLFALMPMGFCFPGSGKSGDLPPRKECAQKWHQNVLSATKDLRLTLLIGHYSQTYYLKGLAKSSLTETVKNYEAYLPEYFTLPHPSPRNNIWMKKNSWFEKQLIPILQEKVNVALKRPW
ncbi:MAG: uracil-DNA glycosylase family protein [Cyclobacteriaceae bacterium]